MSKRELVGSIFTDIAHVIVGDPCKVLYNKRKPETSVSYDDFIRAGMFNREETRDVLGKALAVGTIGGCDGWLDVYVERNKDGAPLRLIVDLTAKVKPGYVENKAVEVDRG